jgi:hypothetical protein
MCGQVVAAPGEKLGCERTNRLPHGEPEPELPWGRRERPHQKPVTRQGLGVGVGWGTGFCSEPQGCVSGGPGVHRRLGQSAPPNFIRKA